jgi:predicted nucleic acid-binding protein
LNRLPRIDVSSDPADNYLLAMATAAEADFLVTGDAKGLSERGKEGTDH